MGRLIRIFKSDETRLHSTNLRKLLLERGLKKLVFNKLGKMKDLHRLLMGAGGNFISPLLICPGVKMARTLERNDPSESIYKCTKNEWMMEEVFHIFR